MTPGRRALDGARTRPDGRSSHVWAGSHHERNVAWDGVAWEAEQGTRDDSRSRAGCAPESWTHVPHMTSPHCPRARYAIVASAGHLARASHRPPPPLTPSLSSETESDRSVRYTAQIRYQLVITSRLTSCRCVHAHCLRSVTAVSSQLLVRLVCMPALVGHADTRADAACSDPRGRGSGCHTTAGGERFTRLGAVRMLFGYERRDSRLVFRTWFPSLLRPGSRQPVATIVVFRPARPRATMQDAT